MSRKRPWVRAILWLADVHRRLLPAYFALLGARGAYAVTAALARAMYRLLPPLRERIEAELRAAFVAPSAPNAPRMPAERVRAAAERAWVQRVWNLADLFLAERLLHPGTYRRCGGEVPEPWLSEMLDVQRRRQPALLVTAYYGPFDLFPVLLAYNGIHAATVYLPHENLAFDAQRRRLRARGGGELVPVDQALQRVPQILERGGAVAIVADHYAEHRGVPVTFLGRPTLALRSVGLLAWRYDADVVVAGIRRVGAFRFSIEVTDVIKHAAWTQEVDPVAYITQRYTRGLEALVLRDPTQYLWLTDRWGPAAGNTARTAAHDETQPRGGGTTS